jgi:hypothetical protein
MPHPRFGPGLALVVLAACGSAADSAKQPSGTLGGAPFTPSASAAYFLPPLTCSIPGVGSEAISAFFLLFSSAPTACADLVDECSVRKSAKSVVVAFETVGIGTANDPTLVPGTYPLASSASISSATTVRPGVLAFAQASSILTDAACFNSGTQFGSGTLVVTRANATEVVGSLDATFGGGDRLSGAFAVPICGTFPIDLCAQLVNGFAGNLPCSSGTTCH